MIKLNGTILLLGLLGLSRLGVAQYFQFSQYDLTPFRVNPAQVALTREASATILNRNQNTGGDFNINSNLFSAVYPFLNSSTGKPWSGVAINLVDDRSGGIFSTQEISLGYVLHVQTARHSTLSFGLSGLYQTRSINTDGLTTSWQYIPDRGFNEGLANGEATDQLRSSYYTLNAGLFWENRTASGEVKSFAGISLTHLTRPLDLFLSAEKRISPSLTLTGGVVTYESQNFRFIPELLVLVNSFSTLNVNLGARSQYLLGKNSKTSNGHIDLITRYVPRRSGIIGLQVHKPTFAIGVSYDFPVFFSNPANQGSIEVGVVLKRPVLTRAEILRERRLKLAEARKLARKPKNPGVVKPAKTDSLRLDPKPTITQQPSEPISSDTLVDIQTAHDTLKANTKIGKISQDPYIVEKITLRFQFQYNSYDLDEHAMDFLTSLTKVLQDDPTLSLKIIGHTDNIGSEEFNRKLSLRRAESIRKALIGLGIKGERLQTEGMGMNQPITTNETDTGRSQNRRVEMLLFKTY